MNRIGILGRAGRLGRPAGGSVNSIWSTLISAVVENATPTQIVLTLSAALEGIIADDFTVAGFTIDSITDPTDPVITITLTSAVVFGNVVRVVVKGRSTTVTNNVEAVIPDGALLNDDDTGLDDGLGNFLAFE